MNTFHYSTACRQILGDLYTPVSTYLKVRDLYPQSALMESSDYHSHDNSRSFIALNPIASIDISHGTVTAQYPDGTQESREINENYPAEQAFNDFLSRFLQCGPIFRTHRNKRLHAGKERRAGHPLHLI